MADLGEKCGVFGVYGKGLDAGRLAFFGLYALQHRGQESSGIATSDGEKIYCHKKMGLVAQVFTEKDIQKLPFGKTCPFGYDEECPEIEKVVPKFDAEVFSEVEFTNGARFSKVYHCILAVILKSKTGEDLAGIAPEYVPLAMLGRIFMKSPKGPLLVLGPDDNTIAVIMPVRLGDK